MKFAKKLSKNSEAILEFILSCFLVSLMVGIVRHLSNEFHILFIIMVRNFLALFFFLPNFISSSGAIFQTKNLKMHFLRGANGAFSMMMWFFAISMMPLSESVSLTFIVPILTTIAAKFFFGEKISNKVFIACAIGLVGVLIILRPGFKEFSFGHFLVLGAVILWSISNLLIKQIAKTEKPTTIVAYMTFFTFIISAPFGLFYIKSLNLISFIWFVLLAALAVLAQILLADAYKKAPLSVLQPFDFSRLIFASLIAYFFFNEKLDFFVFLGASIILAAIIYSLPKRAISTNLLP